MISIKRKYTMPPNDIQKVVHTMALRMKDKYELMANWKNSTHLDFIGNGQSNGISGTIDIHINPKIVIIEVELPFILIGIRDIIQKEITKTLDEEVY